MSVAVDLSESPLPHLTLADLARMPPSDLAQLYAQGRCPHLPDLDGAPPGRMLAVVGPLGRRPGRSVLRRLAASTPFPWRGKSFSSAAEDEGEGINRVRLPVRARDLYRFETRYEPSILDGGPCVFLDYDLPSNPFFIRAIRDELRQVSDGLFLGPALANLGHGHRLVLWFAIDHQ